MARPEDLADVASVDLAGRKVPDPIVRGLGETPASGAATSVYLAAAPEVSAISGAYLVACERRRPSAIARDDDLARRLRSRSEKWAGFDSAGTASI